MSEEMGVLLVVEDDLNSLQLMIDLLTAEGYTVHTQVNGLAAVDDALNLRPDLILLDVMLPGLNGFEICQRLKASPIAADIPVIFLSALTDVSEKIKAFRAGGADYVSKPFPPEEVLMRIKTHLSLYRQRKQIDSLRAQQVGSLEQITQLQNEVLRVVSHDLKVPLSVIKSSAQMLREDVLEQPTPEPRLLEYARMIEQSVNKMTGLIVDLLDAIRLESTPRFDREPIALGDYLRQTLDEHQHAAAAKGLTLTLQAPTPDITVNISPERMWQALQNLISNAVKYTPSGGTVTLSAAQQDSTLRICVQDTGLGIPAIDIPNLFEKFYRVQRPEHQAQSGTGLGLAIVKTVVEQHGGTIEVESVLEEGSTFTVILPLKDQADDA